MHSAIPESCLFEAFNPWSVFVNIRCRGTREAEETDFQEIVARVDSLFAESYSIRLELNSFSSRAKEFLFLKNYDFDRSIEELRIKGSIKVERILSIVNVKHLVRVW